MTNSILTSPSLFKTFLLLLIFLVAAGHQESQAQIEVRSNGETGIGMPPTSNLFGQLHVHKQTSNSDYTLYLRNDANYDDLKRGIYNGISSSGTGGRTGIYNYIYASLNSTSGTNSGFRNITYGHLGTINGMYNWVFQAPFSGSVAYGHYNSLFAQSSAACYGLYNTVQEPSYATGTRFGIYNKVEDAGSGVKYGLYSETPGETNLAGYFNGNVLVNGSFTQMSDARAKEQIAPVSGAVDKLLQLKPKSYYFKDDSSYHTARGLNYGFLAQELETVLPELVKTYEHVVISEEVMHELSEEEIAEGRTEPPKHGKVERTEAIKSVNYTALIPLLVQAIQEQQAEIEALRAQLERD